ncbi:MAG: hypothetical protein JW719_14495, partial [Pirellulales bacterium]|nr:hypothetical protein [Pirellulales bacterium]
GKAFDWLKGVFMNLADDARTALGAIGDALAAGDMALAAQVLWALLKLEWQKGIAYLEGVWEGFKGFWSDAVTGLAIIFNNVTAKIKIFWAEMLGWMQKKWEAFKVSGFSETLANMLAPIFARIQGVSVEATRQTLKEDFARGRKTLPARTDEIDAQTRAKTGQIERDRQTTEDALARDKVRADKARQARIAAAQAEANAARREFEDAVAAARAARDQAATKALTTPALEKPMLPNLANLAAVKASVTGTFSSAVWGLGTGSDAAEETAKNTGEMVGIVRDTRDIMRRQELGGAGILLG